MAWTAPRDWVQGELVVASQFNAHLRDNQDLLKSNIDDDGTLRPPREIPMLLTLADLDGTNPPAQTVTNSVTALDFDDSNTELIRFRLWLPDYYAGEPLSVTALYSMASATSGDVVWAGDIWAISDGDAADADTPSYDDNTATVTVPGTAGHLDVATITLTNDDSVAAGDLVALRFSRGASFAGDTATGDAELRALALSW